METNTILLNRNDYDGLKSFRDFMEVTNTHRVYDVSNWPQNFISADKKIAEIVIKNNNLQEEIDRLRGDKELKEVDFKEMSLFAFLKWKRNN